MFSASAEEFEDLKGYLKSAKVLDKKLIKLSTLKNALKSLDQVPGKLDISEQAAEVENEDDEVINIVGEGFPVDFGIVGNSSIMPNNPNGNN